MCTCVLKLSVHPSERYSPSTVVNRPISDSEDPCEVVDFWGKSKVCMLNSASGIHAWLASSHGGSGDRTRRDFHTS